MKRKLGIIGITIMIIFVTIMVEKIMKPEQVIFINEVRCWDSSNSRTGYYGSDYIEVYNGSEEDVSLQGWYLSDDVNDLKKNQLQDFVIQSKGYLLFYADGTNDTENSLNFKIDPLGEKIFLSDPKGNLMDSIYVPEQRFGSVFARIVDGSDQWSVQEETTGYSNDDAKTITVKWLDEPIFSRESGFYEESFTLKIKTNYGCEIYYTLGGNQSNVEPLKYEDGILIEKNSSAEDKEGAVIVRAYAKDRRGNISQTVTKTYFIGESDYQDKNVISLAADYEDLFGDEGIFVEGKEYLEGRTDVENFLQKGRAWEIKGNFEFLEKGIEKANQEVGIRIQGASSRYAEKKKMSIYAREEYSGDHCFDGVVLGDTPIHSIYTNHSIANIVIPELLADRAVAVQHPMRTVLFLNGEYWYDTYILEKYNKYYLKDNYGVSPENVLIIKDDHVTSGPEDAYQYYLMVRAWADRHDLSIPEEYETLKEKIDVQSYIDYICANVYLCNMDVAEWKNAMCWRTMEDEGTLYGDSRWRWMIYDMDCLQWADCNYYGVSEKAAINSFTEVMQYTEQAICQQMIYASCKKNPEFSKQFVLSFLDMCNVNFTYANVKKVFEKWDYEMEDDLEQFFRNRFDYIAAYMAEEFQLQGTLEEVTIKLNDTDGGSVRLNTTVPDLTDGSWTGKYYTDYPITLTAVPEEGYKFVGWNGSENSSYATIETDVTSGGIILEAVFEELEN